MSHPSVFEKELGCHHRVAMSTGQCSRTTPYRDDRCNSPDTDSCNRTLRIRSTDRVESKEFCTDKESRKVSRFALRSYCQKTVNWQHRLSLSWKNSTVNEPMFCTRADQSPRCAGTVFAARADLHESAIPDRTESNKKYLIQHIVHNFYAQAFTLSLSGQHFLFSV